MDGVNCVVGKSGALLPAPLLPVAEPQPLRQQIGASKCRVTFEQHMARLDFVLKHFPQTMQLEDGIKRPLWPSSAMLQNRFAGQTAIIVGGGHSLTSTFHEMSQQVADLGDKCKIFAPNRSHDWLIAGKRRADNEERWERHPIIPHFGVMADPSEYLIDYQTIHKDVIYLLASSLDYRVLLKYLRAMASVFLWVPAYLEDGSDIQMCAKKYPGLPMHFVSGGSTVGLRTINIALALGFDQVDLYGFDSCYAPNDGELYAYDKPATQHDIVDTCIRCREDGTFLRYRTNVMMGKQALEFYDTLERLPHLSVDGQPKALRVRVHGDGLIPWLAWKASGPNTLISHATPEKMEKKYGKGDYDYRVSKPIVRLVT